MTHRIIPSRTVHPNPPEAVPAYPWSFDYPTTYPFAHGTDRPLDGNDVNLGILGFYRQGFHHHGLSSNNFDQHYLPGKESLFGRHFISFWGPPNVAQPLLGEATIWTALINPETKVIEYGPGFTKEDRVRSLGLPDVDGVIEGFSMAFDSDGLPVAVVHYDHNYDLPEQTRLYIFTIDTGWEYHIYGRKVHGFMMFNSNVLTKNAGTLAMYCYDTLEGEIAVRYGDGFDTVGYLGEPLFPFRPISYFVDLVSRQFVIMGMTLKHNVPTMLYSKEYTDELFWNDEQTVSCGCGFTGDDWTEPAGTHSSLISKEDANDKAIIAALNNLSCSPVPEPDYLVRISTYFVEPFNLVGFAEYVPSSPPRFYKERELGGIIELRTHYAFSPDPCDDPVFQLNKYTFSGVVESDPNNLGFPLYPLGGNSNFYFYDYSNDTSSSGDTPADSIYPFTLEDPGWDIILTATRREAVADKGCLMGTHYDGLAWEELQDEDDPCSHIEGLSVVNQTHTYLKADCGEGGLAIATTQAMQVMEDSQILIDNPSLVYPRAWTGYKESWLLEMYNLVPGQQYKLTLWVRDPLSGPLVPVEEVFTAPGTYGPYHQIERDVPCGTQVHGWKVEVYCPVD